MTTPHNIQHDAHVLTALQAAFEFGRRQHDERKRWQDYDVSNAIRALATGREVLPVAPSHSHQPVIGGGNSLTGKIKWLLENRGVMTRAELDKELNADISNLCSILKSRGEIDIDGRGVTAKVSLRKVVAA